MAKGSCKCALCSLPKQVLVLSGILFERCYHCWKLRLPHYISWESISWIFGSGHASWVSLQLQNWALDIILGQEDIGIIADYRVSFSLFRDGYPEHRYLPEDADPPSLLQEMVAVGMEEGHSHRWGQCVHGVFHFTRELRSDKVSNARRPDYGPTKLFAWIHIPPSLGRHEDGWPLPWGLRALGLASWNIQILEDLILRPGVSNCNITKWFNPSLANEPQHHVFEWTANFHIPFLCLLY